MPQNKMILFVIEMVIEYCIEKLPSNRIEEFPVKKKLI